MLMGRRSRPPDTVVRRPAGREGGISHHLSGRPHRLRFGRRGGPAEQAEPGEQASAAHRRHAGQEGRPGHGPLARHVRRTAGPRRTDGAPAAVDQAQRIPVGRSGRPDDAEGDAAVWKSVPVWKGVPVSEGVPLVVFGSAHGERQAPVRDSAPPVVRVLVPPLTRPLRQVGPVDPAGPGQQRCPGVPPRHLRVPLRRRNPAPRRSRAPSVPGPVKILIKRHGRAVPRAPRRQTRRRPRSPVRTWRAAGRRAAGAAA
jgi:hypothetical protein